MPFRVDELVVSILVNIIAGIIIYVLIYLIRKARASLKSVGILSRIPTTNIEWLKYFARSKNICMMMTRGVLIFGTDKDAGYQVVASLPKNWKGRIRVLLLDPNSKYVEERARELDLKIEHVKQQIIITTNMIRNLKVTYGINIEAKYYNMRPFWRYVLFDNIGYCAYPREENPGYYLGYYKISSTEDSLFEALSKQFEQIWKYDAQSPLNGQAMVR